MIELAAAKGTTRMVSIADDSINFSIVELGLSGTGKSYAIWQIERHVAEAGGCVLALNYNGTHTKMENGNNITHHDVYQRGFPLPVFDRIKHPDGMTEDAEDLVEGILGVFDSIERIPLRQRRELRKAVREALKRGPDGDVFQRIRQKLMESDSESAQGVLGRFYPVFSKLRVEPDTDFLRPGYVSVLDLDGFPEISQCFIAELTLSTVLRHARIRGQEEESPLFVVCDEFQNLNLRPHSALSQILREGRKFKLSLVLATQTLDNFSKAQIATIMQAGTHLFFRPTPIEASRIAKYVGTEDLKAAEQRLMRLQRGECIATGRFQVGAITRQTPITIRF